MSVDFRTVVNDVLLYLTDPPKYSRFVAYTPPSELTNATGSVGCIVLFFYHRKFIRELIDEEKQDSYRVGTLTRTLYCISKCVIVGDMNDSGTVGGYGSICAPVGKT